MCITNIIPFVAEKDTVVYKIFQTRDNKYYPLYYYPDGDISKSLGIPKSLGISDLNDVEIDMKDYEIPTKRKYRVIDSDTVFVSGYHVFLSIEDAKTYITEYAKFDPVRVLKQAKIIFEFTIPKGTHCFIGKYEFSLNCIAATRLTNPRRIH
jgi:hypothetical protein